MKLVLPLFLLVSTSPTFAEESYTLFNPVPKDKLRELSPARPDKADGATTVDAGHFQLETDIFNQAIDKSDGVRSRSTVIGASNLRFGVTQDLEMSLQFVPYQKDVVEGPGTKQDVDGLGDSGLAMRYNFFGNDGGDIALGITAAIKIPTADDELGNDEVEGSIGLPVTLSLPKDWDLGIYFLYSRMRDDSDENKRYHNEFSTAVSASHAIVGDLSGFIEAYTANSAEEGSEWVATIDTGLVYQVNSDLAFDIGVYLAATKAADDSNPFCGFTARF